MIKTETNTPPQIIPGLNKRRGARIYDATNCGFTF
jgi:hypothetical protein